MNLGNTRKIQSVFAKSPRSEKKSQEITKWKQNFKGKLLNL